MNNNKSYISIGDFIDLFYKVRQKGYGEILSKFHLTEKARTVSKWNNAVESSDFWIIPEVRSRWNEKCTGNPSIGYEEYFVSKHLAGKSGLQMLSVGCGSGARERNFGKYPNFSLIEGIEMAPKLVDEAQQKANDLQMNHLKYIVGDFYTHNFEAQSFDVVLFNSSLHHFRNINRLMQERVVPLLKENGYLVIYEYVGPNRLQWTYEQLKEVNRLLEDLPLKYRRRFNSTSIKSHVYRPGLLRMLAVDPSEAVDSESILPAIHRYLKIIEEKRVGWNITHLLFKDIAHNFLGNSKEKQQILSAIFKEEDNFLQQFGKSDAIFGIYQKNDIKKEVV